MKKNEKKIAPKRYVIALVIFIGVILLTIYIFKWYQVFNEKKITKSYLVSSHVISNEINSIDELSSVFTEAPSEYFLYIGYTNDKNVYDMEVGLKKIIRKYELQDQFYYFNVDDIKSEDGYIEKINNALNLKEEKINNVPTILYFKDNTLVSGGIINKDEGSLMQASDLEQLLETMEIEKP